MRRAGNSERCRLRASAALPLPHRHHSGFAARPQARPCAPFCLLPLLFRVPTAPSSCWRRGEHAEGARIGGGTSVRDRKVLLSLRIKLGKYCRISYLMRLSARGSQEKKFPVVNKIVSEYTRNGFIILGLFVYIYAAKTTIKMS